jgi:hypothetical protein
MMVNNVYDYSRRRKIKGGHHHTNGLRKITSIKSFWMVYSKISLYTLESTKRKNMGKFYGKHFWELPQNVQALIIEKLHGNTKT